MQSNDQFLKVDEVILRYRITRSKWSRMVAAKEAPEPLRFGRSLRWRLVDLQAWEEAGLPLQA